MRIAVGAVVAAVGVLLSATASFARGPYGSISVGNWQGGAYTNDKNGAFTHCAAGTTYERHLFRGLDRREWQLAPGLCP
jgi:hypothetical protein